MIVSALITGAILVFIYVVTRGFVHNDFVDRLTQQSESWRCCIMPRLMLRTSCRRDRSALINPSTSIYSMNGILLARKGDYEIPATWVVFLKENAIFNAERKEYTTVGRKHLVNNETYLIFVSDKDLPGERELIFLFRALVGGWIVGLILSYLTGLYFASQALQPVTRVVNEVNQITEDNLGQRLKLDKDLTTDR